MKERGLSPSGGFLSLGLEENRSGCVLSTSLSHSLASASQADRVDLYSFMNNGLDLSSTKKTPQKYKASPHKVSLFSSG
jgi:hypothetical protein